MVTRVLEVAIAASGLAAFLMWRLVLRSVSTKTEQLNVIGHALAVRCDALGGAFAKVGQALSVRCDLLPEEICKALERLQEHMEPMTRTEAQHAIRTALGSDIMDVFDSVDAEPLSSATIAQVHRAVLRNSGHEVVLKIRRPGITRRIATDARLIGYVIRLLPRVGFLKSVALKEAAQLVCDGLVSQCDFHREAETQISCWQALNEFPDVRVPKIVGDLLRDKLIVMEFIPALRQVAACPEHAQKAVLAVLRAVYFLMFCRGIVHCDLHPGNVLIGVDGRAVLLDFGFTAKLCDSERIAFAEFFLAVASNDGPTAADIIRRMAAHVPLNLEIEEFERDIGNVVDDATRRTAAEFSVVTFVRSLFVVQAKHHIRGSHSFTMAILSLLSFEGLVRTCCPRVDFQREAIPLVLEALSSRS